MPEGAKLELGAGISVAWDDLDRARAGVAGDPPAAGWRLEGALDPSHSALRILTGATRDGSLLLLAGARPADAAGHDSESPHAVIVTPSGEVKMIEEALLSTQYAANGQVARVGLELYGAGEDYPVRGAGDATRSSATEESGHRNERTVLEFRLDGEPGMAVFDVLHA